MGATGAGMVRNYWGLEMFTTAQIESTRKAVKCLNDSFNADPGAIHALICNRVPCNETFAADPFISVDAPPVLVGDGHYCVGMLGVLVGVLSAMGLPRIAVKWSSELDDDGRKKLEGFCLYEPDIQDPVEAVEPRGVFTPVGDGLGMA